MWRYIAWFDGCDASKSIWYDGNSQLCQGICIGGRTWWSFLLQPCRSITKGRTSSHKTGAVCTLCAWLSMVSRTW